MADPGPIDRLSPPPTPNLPGAQGAEVPAPAGDEAAVTRGFLFADLRDYTSYVDTHGNRAGAALLERYRRLVREVVAAAHGAEIRTEGDSFYVVFGSVSAAVRAGLSIIEAAAAMAADADPIRVGVGVHAGETIETAEGFVGSAVNIAARLCAEAKAGEIVVSDTVRGLTRTQIEAEFQPLGARHLKGVVEPVACYRVVSRGAAAHAPAVRRVGRRPSRLLAAVLGLAALVALAAAGVAVLLGGGRAAAPTPGPSAPAAARSLVASASPGASAAPAPSASLGPFPNEVEAAILAALPSTLAQTCVRGGTPDDARLAGFSGRNQEPWDPTGPGEPLNPAVANDFYGGVTCKPAAGADRLYVMDVAGAKPSPGNPSYTAPGDEYLGRLEGKYMLPSGHCATEGRAHETWANSRGGGGELACMNPYDGRPWIYFSFDTGRYLAFATRDDSDYGALYAWWDQLKTFLP